MALSDNKNKGIFHRAGYALAGITASLQTERSFRAQVYFAAAIFLLLLVTRPAPIWWAILLLASGCSMATELINTAVEKLADHLHPDIHPVMKVVKDTLAGAVCVSVTATVLVLAAFVWSLVSQ